MEQSMEHLWKTHGKLMEHVRKPIVLFKTRLKDFFRKPKKSLGNPMKALLKDFLGKPMENLQQENQRAIPQKKGKPMENLRQPHRN